MCLVVLACVSVVQSDVRPPLKVEVFHVAVAAHQESAIICLSLLKDLAEKTASFRRIISQVLVDLSFQPWGQSILDKFFISDSSLWIGKYAIMSPQHSNRVAGDSLCTY